MYVKKVLYVEKTRASGTDMSFVNFPAIVRGFQIIIFKND